MVEDQKMCPLIAIASYVGRAELPTPAGHMWAHSLFARCAGPGCAWWNDEHKSCSVTLIVRHLSSQKVV
jgi:hypothetical protein